MVGGTCVNRGCVPSKALLAISGRMRELQDEHHLKALGIKVHQYLLFFVWGGIDFKLFSLFLKIPKNTFFYGYWYKVFHDFWMSHYHFGLYSGWVDLCLLEIIPKYTFCYGYWY